MGISNRLIPNTVTAIMITLKMRISKSFLVAGPGLEPGTKAYETYMMPFQHPAIVIVILHDHQLSVNLGTIPISEAHGATFCFSNADFYPA